MNEQHVTRRAARWLSVGVVVVGSLVAGGCEQILGIDGTYKLDTTSTGGSGGSTASGGSTGGATGGSTGGTTSMQECTPGTMEACYSGPDGTQDVGNCKGGMRTCSAMGVWGGCEGEVTPMAEDPGVYGDEACDGYAAGEALCAAIFGDPSQQTAEAVTVDATGNMFVVGQLMGAISFGATTVSAAGGVGVFIAKLAPDCKPIWATQVAGAAHASDVTLDAAGNPIVAGWSYDNATLDNFNVPKSIFVAKLDGSTGAALWLTGCGGDIESHTSGVAIGKNGSIVFAGFHSGTINCGDGPHTIAAQREAFVSNLNPDDGTANWTKTYPSTQYSEANALAVDPSGNIIVAGSFGGSLNLGGGGMTANGMNAFLLHLTSSGVHISSSRLGDGSSQRVGGIAVGAQAALYIAGTFQGTIDMPGVGTLTNNTVPHLFVLKQLAGGNFEWGWSSTMSKGDSASSVTTDSAGHPIVGLEFDGDIEVKGAILTNLGSSGSLDGLLLKLNDDGTVAWTRQFGDGPVMSVATGADDSIATCGRVGASFNDTIDLGTGPLDPQGDDAFVVRHAP